MKGPRRWWAILALSCALAATADDQLEDAVWRHRNLGKAFYENPTTRQQAVEEFAKALALLPDSPRERVNLGLALLRAGETERGIAELERAQRADGRIPHTYFNLGIAYQQKNQVARAIVQLEGLLARVPDEPIASYNLGVLYKLGGDAGKSLAFFERSARLAPELAGPHFQLATAYRQAGRTEDAQREMALFRAAKARIAASGTEEDLEWSWYSEIYEQLAADPPEAPPGELRFAEWRLGEAPGVALQLALFDVDGDSRPELFAYTSKGVKAWRPAGHQHSLVETGLEGQRGVHFLAPADFDGDGAADLAVVEAGGARLFKNDRGFFRQLEQAAPRGDFRLALWLDFDHDYDLDLFLLGRQCALWRNEGEAGFADRSAAFPFAPGQVEAAVRLHGMPDTQGIDLVVAGPLGGTLYRDLLGGKFAASPLPAVPANSLRMAAADLDADGYTDLLVRSPAGLSFLRNDHQRGFTAAAIATTDTTADPRGPLALFDLDNRGAQEVFAGGVLHALQGPFGPRNLVVDPTFRPQGGGNPPPDPLKGAGGNPLERPRGKGGANPLPGSEKVGSGSARGAGGGNPLPLGSPPPPSAERGAGGRAPLPWKLVARLSLPAFFAGSVAVAAADFDGDGRVDLATGDAAGQVFFRRNLAAEGGSLRLSLEGGKSGKLALGAEIEVKAGRRYQKLAYEGFELVAGVGDAAEIDTLRITWPNGLIQNETRIPPGSRRRIKEAQRLSGSCPMVFTWNGEAFELITDVLGVAPLGATSGDGSYFPVDHDEVVTLPGRALRERDGHLEVRLTEELREVTYLDRVRLLAVDRPAGSTLLTNDKFKGPPFPEFRLFALPAEKARPRAARDDAGRDVLAALLASDQRYPDGFARDLDGRAVPHHLELDFAPAELAAKPLLVLAGWVDWADGSSFLAAAQAGRPLAMPSLEARGEDGEWRPVLAELGMPAGKPKTIVVELAGKLPAGASSLRIATSLCVYWDEIYLATEILPSPLRLSPVSLAGATLAFRGFSRVVAHPERKQPERFLYAEVSPTSLWNPTPGFYTRYGPVAEPLAENDDRLVIFGSGDELRLSFAAGSTPPPAAGWERDYLLLVDGWAKDRDANTAFGQSVEPLPYQDMAQYPYGEPPDDSAGAPAAFPAGDRQRIFRELYQTRPALRLLRPLREAGRPHSAAQSPRDGEER